MAEKYKITTQRPIKQPTPSGQFVDVMRVSFETPTGFEGSVDVPMATYGPETVSKMIDEYVAKVDAVQGL